MENKQIDQEKIDQISKALIEVAENNEATLQEFEDASYKVRQYYNANAVLKKAKED